MSKFNVKGLNCFKQVAKVIGEARAKYELYKVMNCGKDFTDGGFYPYKGGLELMDSFDWSSTPQGYEFWDAVDSGHDPYEVEEF